MKIYLITRNPSKILAAKSVFDKYNIKIQGVKKIILKFRLIQV